ncbi:hypothetical protein PybrP1_004596 [[Pythium] brassicae (nom. inval.)]|nr:hypothetical protein PybrP1_004596 [[Pythium] brassicae (nom. inval.)]
MPKYLGSAGWDAAQVFGTANFFTTIATSALVPITEFARLVDAVIVFRDGSILLLSEYEADRVLRLLWACKRKDQLQFRFINLAYAVDAAEKGGFDARAVSVPLGIGPIAITPLELEWIALLQLYNGETMFTRCQKALFKAALRVLLVDVPDREAALREFVDLRTGSLLRWPRSFLHAICLEMDLESAIRA